jgi:peptidoglycan/xylan/chitin deacetylase (PgdA/CDA1 family)
VELALGLVLLLYGLSDLLFRFLGLGAYARGSRREPKVALTFDDGPSETTEALLALLKAHGVKATFFLTGERAKKRPDLVEKIREAGHQIEDHGQIHQAWKLLLPWVEWRHMAENPARYYRPPHGLHTPFTRPFARILGKRVALWDLESKDWLDLPPEALAERLLYYLRPGSVVLLHDGPERTLELLKLALPRMLELGYRPVTLDELSPIPLRAPARPDPRAFRGSRSGTTGRTGWSGRAWAPLTSSAWWKPSPSPAPTSRDSPGEPGLGTPPGAPSGWWSSPPSRPSGRPGRG